MIIRGLDTNGEWVWGNGLNAYQIQQAAIIQNIETKVLEWVGDCFFDLTAGIDWTNLLGSSSTDILETQLKILILNCYGVINLTELTLTFDGRNFTINYTIDTIYSSSAQATITNS